MPYLSDLAVYSWSDIVSGSQFKLMITTDWYISGRT